MEKEDREKILALLQENTRLRRLYREHQHLERLLNKYSNPATFLTPSEQLELQMLKKRKLLGVDTMMAILADSK